MAVYNPPTEKLPIFDNSVFISSNGSSTSSAYLTIAQANLLYLRKTYPDTATALETFNLGILTSGLTLSSTIAPTATVASQGGCGLGWNYSTTNGETDLINYRGTFSPSLGGFNFYDQATTPSIIAPDLLMSITRATTGVTINPNFGGLYVNSINIANGLTLPLALYTPTTTQLGGYIISAVTTNVAIGATTLTTPITTISLPIGIWQCSYACRMYNPTGGSTVAAFATYMASNTSISASYPNLWGYQQSCASSAVGILGPLNMSNACSAVIVCQTPSIITLNVYVAYTGTGALQIYGVTPQPQSYLSAVKIG